MYNFRSIHVGKDLFRAKTQEEHIKIIDEIHDLEFPVSLKAYGDGPLQLSTDKNASMFPRLERERQGAITGPQVSQVFDDPAFADFGKTNVLPLIYNEATSRCNILVFDYERARSATHVIRRVDDGGRRKHPVYHLRSPLWWSHRKCSPAWPLD